MLSLPNPSLTELVFRTPLGSRQGPENLASWAGAGVHVHSEGTKEANGLCAGCLLMAP